MSSTPERVRSMADRLISTLDQAMESERADAIVRDVAEEIYHDILGMEGSVVIDTDKPVTRMHGGFGSNGKRGVLTLVSYRFKPKAVV